MNGAEVVILSPDEKTVYASSPVANSLVVLNRAEDDGVHAERLRQHFDLHDN